MKILPIVIEKCTETGLYVASFTGFIGAHYQGGILEELRQNMIEVISMLLEDENSLHN